MCTEGAPAAHLLPALKRLRVATAATERADERFGPIFILDHRRQPFRASEHKRSQARAPVWLDGRVRVVPPHDGGEHGDRVGANERAAADRAARGNAPQRANSGRLQKQKGHGLE